MERRTLCRWQAKGFDDLVERAKHIGIEEAWQVLKNEGYKNQFEANWKMVNDSVRVVGGVVTAQFMPSRPDVEIENKERGKEQGRKGNTNAWPIDVLTKGEYMWQIVLVKLHRAH
jgi:hypothetical protein